MSLTDDWKGGKLKYGWYWVTNSKRGVVPDQYMPDDNWLVSNGFCITEVLAPCDYDELQRLEKENDDLSALITGGELEIGHLRHLLKECRTAFETYAKEDETCGLEEENKYAKHLLTRINAAISESEE